MAQYCKDPKCRLPMTKVGETRNKAYEIWRCPNGHRNLIPKRR